MAVNEVRLRLRRKLEELLGVDEADLLMDRPPGGWGDLVTTAEMDRRFNALSRELDARFAAVEHKIQSTVKHAMAAQTWRLLGAMIALVGLLAAAIRL